MEKKLFVGVGRLSLFFRQARSLKDKRNVIQSLKQKLRNEGWSVVEISHEDDPKRAFLGCTYAAASYGGLESAFEKASFHFLGNFEVVQKSKEILEFEIDGVIDESKLTRSVLGDRDEE